jgi:hypothetical protein
VAAGIAVEVPDAPAWFAHAVKLDAPPGQSSTDPERSLPASANIARYSSKDRALMR